MNTKKEERDEDTQQLGDDHLHSAVEDAQSEPPILTFILCYTKNKTKQLFTNLKRKMLNE